MARSKKETPIRYRIRPVDPAAHLFEVSLTVDRPDPAGQLFALPAWIPGSYMIREFARHIGRIEARSAGRRVRLEKVDKHGWRAARCAGPLELVYRVYAWDLSVRAAHLDESHGFFNGTSVFLRVLGQEASPCLVEIEPPQGEASAGWKVATTLPRAGARPHGFGGYRAADYDELLDHPVEMGEFSLLLFEAAGVPHEVAITGRNDCDSARLGKDLAAVCEAQVRLFEPDSGKAPFERYLFLTMAVGDGYGGLEHRSSTALLCRRDDLPWPGMTGVPDGYRQFLGLASHEYFHSWHVKRIKPQAFAPYDLERENHTRLLWVFEGFTSYYDDLMLVRAGVIGTGDYLKALGNTISQVLRGPGRHEQSVAESSFDAWIKYYRQDENSPNAIVSYYAKGALVALCLDLAIRSRTGGRRSLDDLMRLMWQRYGRDFDRAGKGVGEDEIPALLEEATGLDLGREVRAWTEGTGELPLAALLKEAGVSLELKRPEGETAWLGIRSAMRAGDLTITTALSGGPAHRAGVSAGDVIVAVDGLRVDERGLKTLLARRRAGQAVRVHAFRRDELIERVLTLVEAPATEAGLSVDPKAGAQARRLAEGWLGVKTPRAQPRR
ncbi:M61 family metallopeptidase [Quisquiliibacterium transsilvanicum]|uniref:Putative metalloprotease with PDZ domain n=1 Tax=Quisquiliibacterium transsilvanicum TaxID=1549638 RepID=A0A7W8HL80_9BURK|nr:PDZ domain-containing protein [Quisquiliibacterium transsilvanicum]MBB5273907.1 putative metalloprotease with PDZ domain [Quisquiliibacterium transsilvanicum]